MKYSIGQQIAAWSVHAFTSSGMVAGFLSIVAVSEHNFLMAFVWLLVAFVIDGVDGTFARMARVTEVLPQMSGKTIDYVVDFANYAVIPAYIIYAAPIHGTSDYLIPDALRIWAAVIIVLVSAIYYGKEGMVSDDYYFIGFPVMWNFVAFYLYYVFSFPPMVNFLLVVLFGVLHFVPLKYLYPSRTQKYQLWNILVFVSGGIASIFMVVLIEQGITNPILYRISQSISIFTIVYTFILAIYHTYFDKDTRGV